MPYVYIDRGFQNQPLVWTDDPGYNPGDYYTGTNWSYSPNTPAATAPAATAPTTPAATTPTSSYNGTGATAGAAGQVVAGTAQADNQINVADYGGQIALNPALALNQDDAGTTQNESMNLSERTPDINPDAAGTNINGTDPKYNMDPNAAAGTAAQGTATTVAQVDPRQTNTYDAALTQDNVTQNGQATAAQGQVSNQATITDVPQLDIQGTATGVNQDGSVNNTGLALNDYAYQDMTNIIDTSTPAGKALAESLGRFGYTDSKATMKGQLELLQSEFTGPNGEPKIPAWAAATSRNVAKIAAFKGVTGTAATAAMAQALMEASLPIAQADAQFFQTLSLQNLTNAQSAIINKANVLAKFDLTNADNRMAAAIQNSKNFLDMDMKNLDNRQQTEMINTQSRVQSILEDAKSVNAQRLFTAQSQNEMDKFYDELSTAINKYNADSKNSMEQFNTGESNSMTKFNSEMRTNREQFYKNMQYNIDLANAKWRQEVTLTEAQMGFEAAATDVKNMVGISVEQLNQLWDRSDSLLDYVWKSSESELDRKMNLTIAQLQTSTQKTLAQMSADAQDSAGWGSIFGTIGGEIAKDFDFSKLFSFLG